MKPYTEESVPCLHQRLLVFHMFWRGLASYYFLFHFEQALIFLFNSRETQSSNAVIYANLDVLPICSRLFVLLGPAEFLMTYTAFLHLNTHE